MMMLMMMMMRDVNVLQIYYNQGKVLFHSKKWEDDLKYGTLR